MEATRKRQLKRRVKTLRWSAWGCVGLFILILASTIILRQHSDADWNKPVIMISILLAITLPLFAGLILTTYSSFTINELLYYRKQIWTYRARKFAGKAIDELLRGNVRPAIDEYIKSGKYPDRTLDDYMYGILVGAAAFSGDEKLKKIGVEKLTKIQEEFHPDKVKL